MKDLRTLLNLRQIIDTLSTRKNPMRVGNHVLFSVPDYLSIEKNGETVFACIYSELREMGVNTEERRFIRAAFRMMQQA